jgi:hypothetical protein
MVLVIRFQLILFQLDFSDDLSLGALNCAAFSMCCVCPQVFCLKNSTMTLRVTIPTTPAILPHRTSSSWRALGPGWFQYGKYRIIFMYFELVMGVYCQTSRVIHRDLLSRVSVLSCPRARQLYRIGSLRPPGHSLMAAVLMDAMKETSVLIRRIREMVKPT